MEYVRLGSTGLEVSRLVLGCMSFGDPKRGTHPWTLDEESSRPLIRQAVEAGINFFDTSSWSRRTNRITRPASDRPRRRGRSPKRHQQA